MSSQGESFHGSRAASFQRHFPLLPMTTYKGAQLIKVLHTGNIRLLFPRKVYQSTLPVIFWGGTHRRELFSLASVT